MAKSKKHREESSESEDSTASSSSSDSSSTESSSSEDKLKKKRKMKKTKDVKSKKRRKKSSSSSSSSSSSDSEDESTSSSSTEDESPKKKKMIKEKLSKDKKDVRVQNEKPQTHSHEKRFDKKPLRYDIEDVKKETSDSHNRSKWDSPSHEFEENRRDRAPRNRDRDYYDGNNRNNDDKRNRRYEDNRDDRYPHRRNEHWGRPERDYDRRRERDRDYDKNRDRNRDQKNYRSRDNNYNDKRYNNKEDKDRRDDRENRRSRSPRRPRNFPRRRSNEDGKSYDWGKKEENEKPAKSPEEKDKPNFGLSGKLAEDTNKVNGIVIKYAEPPEARKPKRRWRLYPFKGEKALPTLYIHRQSCYLIGRDRKVCDLPVDHPSCSKQHAALQYRLVPFEREDGTVGKRVRPYLIDLESANGTFINNKKIESKKYIELLEKDVIKFGFSSREYVLLHENSKEDQLDDDIKEEVQVKEEPAE